MEALRVEDLCYAYERAARAVDGVNLALEPGTFFCLLGPSGCGKTTLLRLIGGYLSAQRGRIFLGSTDVTHLPPERRHLGMVFQNYALFPHLTARGNVAFGLEARGVPRRERLRRVEDMLERVGLSPAERARRPGELSGGQQQRVALARALVIEPRLLLLDEPWANLDRPLGVKLRAELRQLQRSSGLTTLLVTHDQEEALALADRVGVMRGGRLLQIDAPADLYARPRTPFVARFVGHANLFAVIETDGADVRLQDGLSIQCQKGAGKGGWLLIRPERFVLGPAATLCPTCWPGQVVGSAFLGADQLLEVAVGKETIVKVRCRPGEAPSFGTLSLGIPADAAWMIPEADPPQPEGETVPHGSG